MLYHAFVGGGGDGVLRACCAEIQPFLTPQPQVNVYQKLKPRAFRGCVSYGSPWYVHDNCCVRTVCRQIQSHCF